MPAPSHRFLLFSAVLLLVIALPVVLFAYSALRVLFIPPVSGTRFIGYDGLQLAGSCTDRPAAKGGRAWVCNGSFHIDSRFAIINHDSGAVAWCIQSINDSHFNERPPMQLGPLTVGVYPHVPADWGGCTETLPMRAGLYGQIIVNH